MALNFDDGTWGSAGSMIESVGILEGEVIRRCGSEQVWEQRCSVKAICQDITP